MDELIDRAIRVASLAHAGQYRKGSQIPYISHPFAVALILQGLGASREQIAAGILHDTLEDTDYTHQELLNDFGSVIAGYVLSCSEPDPEAPWEIRKQHTLDSLELMSREVKLIVCADKLHNLLSIKQDLLIVGEQVWERFGKGRELQAWYYKGVAEILCQPSLSLPLPTIFGQFKALVEEVFGS